MPDVRDVVIPLESKPQRLRVLFNNSAYMQIKELTGHSAFALAQDQDKLQDPKVCIDLLFAGTRKFHSHPNVSHEQLLEWLDMIDSHAVFDIYGQIIAVFCASFLHPSKREAYWKTVNAKLNKTKEEKPTAA